MAGGQQGEQRHQQDENEDAQKSVRITKKQTRRSLSAMDEKQNNEIQETPADPEPEELSTTPEERLARILAAAEQWQTAEVPPAYWPYRPELVEDEHGIVYTGNCPVCWPAYGALVVDKATGKARCWSGCSEVAIERTMFAASNKDRELSALDYKETKRIKEEESYSEEVRQIQRRLKPGESKDVYVPDKGYVHVTGDNYLAHLPRDLGRPQRPILDRLLSVEELASLPPIEWLVDSTLPLGGLLLLWGQPATYKSFVALDWACSISVGIPWLGREVKTGPVVYVAGEGKAGICARITAWHRRHAPADLGTLRILPGPVDLRNEGQVFELVEACEELRPRLVVLDTLARMSTGAEENSAKDMGEVVGAIDRIRATGAAVALLHHGRKDDAVARGSGALAGAVDTSIKAERKGKARLRLLCEKQKDADEFPPLDLLLETVEVTDGATSLAVWDVNDAPLHVLQKAGARGVDLDSSIVAHLHAHPAQKARDIRVAVHRRDEDVRAALKRLKAAGVVVEAKGSWSLASADSAGDAA